MNEREIERRICQHAMDTYGAAMWAAIGCLILLGVALLLSL